MSRVLTVLLIVQVLAAGCGKRTAPHITADADTAWVACAPAPGTFGGNGFFVGAWCSPRATERSVDVWRTFAEDGFTLAVRPLEDRNVRGANHAMLTTLDSLRSQTAGVRALVRDDAVHPDEVTRDGWQDRVRQVVAAYRDAPLLGGYFVADEPQPATFPQVAQVCRAFADADSVHPAYVNVLGLDAAWDEAKQAKWRADVTSLVRDGGLRVFTFDAYAHGPKGESSAYLLTLAAAARVARATGAAFAPVLQFTGYADNAPVTAATARYLAAEAVAHGASGIVWFTYWTPDPAEKAMRWRGGAIEFDGARGDRADSLRAIQSQVRKLRELAGAPFLRAAHFGGLPDGVPPPATRIPGLVSVAGGPATVATTAASGPRAWLVINRDQGSKRVFQVVPARDLTAGTVVTVAFDGRSSALELPARLPGGITLPLEPGASALVFLTTH